MYFTELCSVILGVIVHRMGAVKEYCSGQEALQQRWVWPGWVAMQKIPVQKSALSVHFEVRCETKYDTKQMLTRYVLRAEEGLVGGLTGPPNPSQPMPHIFVYTYRLPCAAV